MTIRLSEFRAYEEMYAFCSRVDFEYQDAILDYSYWSITVDENISRVFGIYANNKPVGVLWYSGAISTDANGNNQRAIAIDFLTIAEEYQRQGIGSKVLAMLLQLQPEDTFDMFVHIFHEGFWQRIGATNDGWDDMRGVYHYYIDRSVLETNLAEILSHYD